MGIDSAKSSKRREEVPNPGAGLNKLKAEVKCAEAATPTAPSSREVMITFKPRFSA